MILRLVGLAVFAAGIVLLVLAYNATQSVGEELRQQVTGDYSRETIWYIVGGIVCLVIGGGLALMAPRLHRRL